MSRKERKRLTKPKKYIKDEEVKKWEEGLTRAFKGYLPGITRENERDAWRHINEVVDEALSRYDTTMEEDDLQLAADDKRLEGELLSVNNRNCILYRKSEKAILHFLKECAKRVDKIITMTAWAAKEWIDSWPDDIYK